MKVPLARYLKSNLKTSWPDWFEGRVIIYIKDRNMKIKAETDHDIKVLDEKALLEVFLGNWSDIKEVNNIPDAFKNTIHRALDIRHKYKGHEGIILDINTTGYQDLDTLIDFADQIGALDLKEEIQRERDKEILRLANDIKSRSDSRIIEPIDIRDCDAEVLSVSAAETMHLIKKYQVHSCPDSYFYKKTKYITFRIPPDGVIKAIYEINKVFVIPKDFKNNLEYFDSQGLSIEEMERLGGYIDNNPFVDNDRFYLLSMWKELSCKFIPKEYTAKAEYCSINQLLASDDEE